MKPMLQIPTGGIPAFVFPFSPVTQVEERFSCCASPVIHALAVQKYIIHYHCLDEILHIQIHPDFQESFQSLHKSIHA